MTLAKSKCWGTVYVSVCLCVSVCIRGPSRGAGLGRRQPAAHTIVLQTAGLTLFRAQPRLVQRSGEHWASLLKRPQGPHLVRFSAGSGEELGWGPG